MSLSEAEVDAIAARVVELLGSQSPAAVLVDAVEIAKQLGISRSTVYERSDELGAVRLGDGPRARLRFDPVEVTQRLAQAQRPREPRTGSPGHRSGAGADSLALLPIRGEAPR